MNEFYVNLARKTIPMPTNTTFSTFSVMTTPGKLFNVLLEN